MNVNPKTQQAYQLLHDGTLAFARAERQGIRVDLIYAESKEKEMTKKIHRLEHEFKQSDFYKNWKKYKTDINIYSSKQLGKHLYKDLNLEITKQTKTGQGSTDIDALEQLNIPDVKNIIEIKKLKKIRDTYLAGFIREQVNGYIHPHFNLHTVRTYRSSSNAPNFQNVPKRDEYASAICRGALFPRPGHQLVEIDYGALEVSIAACYHKDPKMIQYLKDGKDFHADIAKEIFFIDKKDYTKKKYKTYRSAAKNGFTFAEFYGDYYKNCAEALAYKWCQLPKGKRWKAGQGIKWPTGGNISDQLIKHGIKTIDDFIDHIQEMEDDLWKNKFPTYAKWKKKQWPQYQKKGYLDTYTGFRCSGVMKENDVINYPVQGAAFHCMLWSFTQSDKIMLRENWDTKLIGQVHDSMVFDVLPTELDYIIKTVQNITCIELPKVFKWINVPLNVEADIYPVDGSWTKKIN